MFQLSQFEEIQYQLSHSFYSELCPSASNAVMDRASVGVSISSRKVFREAGGETSPFCGEIMVSSG